MNQQILDRSNKSSKAGIRQKLAQFIENDNWLYISWFLAVVVLMLLTVTMVLHMVSDSVMHHQAQTIQILLNQP